MMEWTLQTIFIMITLKHFKKLNHWEVPIFCSILQVTAKGNSPSWVVYMMFFWQSIWVSARGAQRELDEAKMRFAAAEVVYFILNLIVDLLQGLCL